MREGTIGHHFPRAAEHSRNVIQGISETVYCRLLDRIADVSLPPRMMLPVLEAYCRLYGVNRAEVPAPLEEYRSLRQFFIRPMRAGQRRIDTDPARLTSPVDGTVLAAGWYGEAPLQTLHIKGKVYTVEDLLGTRRIPPALAAGGYILFYLAPGNYHCYHCPIDGQVTGWDYHPGTCWPVNSIGRRIFPDVYATNRRVVVWLKSTRDPEMEACLVLIGAMGVGRMTLEIGQEHIVCEGDREMTSGPEMPLPIHRGERLGHFDLGSSAVLLWSNASCRSTILATEGPIRLGVPVVALGERSVDA